MGGQLALAAFALAGAALLALAMVLALSARPAAAAGGGTVAGTVRSSSGTTLAGIRVDAFNGTYGNLLATTTSDPAGAYQLTGLPSYAVVVRFSDPAGTWSTQYFDRVATFASATRLTVPASTTATADAALVPRPGIVTGRITSSTGPLTGISVTVLDPVTNATVATTTSNATGTYKFTGVPTGTYLVRFTDPTGTHGTEYFPNAPTSGTAIPLTLTATTGAVADGELAPTGAISGRLTAGRVALPAVWAVLVTPQPLTIAAAALTDTAGNYTIDHVTAGTYKLVFVDTTWTAGSSTGYRPIVYPDLDGGDPTTQLATIAAGADQTIPAGGTLNGRDGHLRGADCTPAIDGHPTTVTGTTWAGRKLMGCNLSGFSFSNSSLAGADLRGADLTATNLWSADLSGADLTGAVLTGADVGQAKLGGATLTGVRGGGMWGPPSTLPADWRFRYTLDLGYLLGPGADLTNADLRYLTESLLDLTGATMAGADLRWSVLTYATFTGVDLTTADLRFSTIRFSWSPGLQPILPTDYFTSGNNLLGPWVIQPSQFIGHEDLSYRNLSGADLSNGYIDGTGVGIVLRDTNLTGNWIALMSMVGADLRGAVLTNAHLATLDLTDADLTGSIGVPTLASTPVFSNTICPTGVNSDANGGTCVGQGW